MVSTGTTTVFNIKVCRMSQSLDTASDVSLLKDVNIQLTTFESAQVLDPKFLDSREQ